MDTIAGTTIDGIMIVVLMSVVIMLEKTMNAAIIDVMIVETIITTGNTGVTMIMDMADTAGVGMTDIGFLAR